LFLLAFAIVDDIGAIVVIAVFYSEGVSFTWLAIAAAALVAALAIRSRIGWIGAYVALGGLCWFALHEAHVHPTLAGVAFGLASPVTPRRTQLMVDAVEVPDDVDYATAWDLTKRARESVSVVEWLQHRLHPWSAFLVVPAFALANAGVPVSGESIREAVSADVTWGIVLGLVVGKAVGITAATRLAVALGIGRLPGGMTWRYVTGAGMLGGIGFTVSLFVTELAFGDSILAEDARLAVLFASLVAGVIGCAIVLPGRVGDRLEDAISSGYES
jgi:NhaA family Na+:H+ antiporter